MLRITVTESALEQRWILQGSLTKHSVVELVSNWRASRDRQPTQTPIVDLNDVTSIDKSGEEVLSMMIRDGAEFVARGVYTTHLLESLKARATNRANSE
jgi:ABC-type transporter Mla MlaB component